MTIDHSIGWALFSRDTSLRSSSEPHSEGGAESIRVFGTRHRAECMEQGPASVPLGELLGEKRGGDAKDDMPPLGEFLGEAANEGSWTYKEAAGNWSVGCTGGIDVEELAPESGHAPCALVPSPRRNQDVESKTARKSDKHASVFTAAMALGMGLGMLLPKPPS